MIKRVAAGLIGLAVLLPLMIWGGQLAAEIVVPMVMVVCIDEYARMAFPDDRWPALSWSLVTTFAWYGSLLYLPTRYVGLAAALLLVATMVFVVLRPGPTLVLGADRIGRYTIGTLWIGALAFFPLLRRLEDGLAWIFLVLVISWLSDTGGYFAGRFLGKHKMYERVSPKKTWEGFAGGLAAATLGVLVVKLIGLPNLTILDVVVLGTAVAGVGVLGDLAESLLKRAHDVKDAGSIMPGHGGLLDRIDSVLFVAPVIFGYAVWVKGY